MRETKKYRLISGLSHKNTNSGTTRTDLKFENFESSHGLLLYPENSILLFFSDIKIDLIEQIYIYTK